jgi:hypothetical protein
MSIFGLFTHLFIKNRDLFWLVVSVVIVHGQLAPLLWACGETEHLGSKSMRPNKVVHLIMTKKQREWQRGRSQGQDILQSHAPGDLFLPLKPNLLRLHHLLIIPSIRLWLHQWINPLKKSEPSWSSHPQKAPSVGNQTFSTWAFWKKLHTKIIILYLGPQKVHAIS